MICNNNNNNNDKVGFIFLLNTLVNDEFLELFKNDNRYLIINKEVNRRVIYDRIKEFILKNEYTDIHFLIVSTIKNYNAQVFLEKDISLESFIENIQDSCYNNCGKYLESIHWLDFYINVNEQDNSNINIETSDFYNSKILDFQKDPNKMLLDIFQKFYKEEKKSII